MRRVLLTVLAVSCVGAGALPAWSLPRFSLQEGEGCHLCHTNPSGGGLRNGYGVEEFGNDTLAAHDGRDVDAAITDEVCFRLGEDADSGVRLSLRKNPHCHPLVRAALRGASTTPPRDGLIGSPR